MVPPPVPTPGDGSSPRSTGQSAAPVPRPWSAGRVLVCLLPLLALFPPETQGVAQAGAAALIVLLALLIGERSSDARGRSLIVVGALAALAFSRVALVPAAAIEPVAIALLAAAAGLGAARCAEDERATRGVLSGLAAVAGCVALYAVHQKLWGLDRLADAVLQDATIPDREAVLARLARGRAFARFATPAALGGFLALVVPATLGLAVWHRGRGRVWLLAVSLAGGAAFLAAASATAGAALLVAVALAAVTWSRARRGMLVAGLALALLLASVAWLRGGRVIDLDDPEGPWRLRAGNFRAAAAMAVEHPWLGVGPGSFAAAYPAYLRSGDNEVRHAHDLPLELLAEWGVPSGIAWSVLFFTLFLGPLWYERRSAAWRRGVALGLAAFALQNLADFTASMPSLLWTAALLRGLLARPAAALPSAGRLLRASSLVLVVLAATLVALGGLARDARSAARAAAFAGESDRAWRMAQRATRLAPWDVDAALLAGRLAVAAARESDPLGAARERAEHAVRLAPVSAAARELRAEVRLRSADAPGAFADLREAARLHPLHAGYAASRDRLRTRLERPEDPPR